MSELYTLTQKIKGKAQELGFTSIGIAKAQEVEAETIHRYMEWLKKGYHGSMSYMERNIEIRRDPRLLLEGCQSIIMVAINYYPKEKQPSHLPKISYYAYGRDYHKVIKKRLDKLLAFIKEESIDKEVIGRSFTDSAPIMERYWAVKAGLGWIGKNSLLIIPKLGSFFFLGTLLINIPLIYDEEMEDKCGPCTKCLHICPTKAITQPRVIDANRCISYLTIENQDEIPTDLVPLIGDKIYGCDACQECCPWNRKPIPTTIEDFAPRSYVYNFDFETIEGLTIEEFDTISQGSAIRRIGLQGLQRTARVLKKKK